MKNFRIDAKYIIRSVLVGLLVVGLAQFVLNWFGPFALCFLGKCVMVNSLAGPAVAGLLLAAAGILKPQWVWNHGSVLLLMALVAANLVYTEASLRTLPPLKNELCPPEKMLGLYEDYNIVLISLDTLRADRLGAYGNENDTSPWMDRLAKEGVLFENNFSAAPATLISHATMFTGMYPGAHGAQCMTYTPLPASANTITEILSMNGYRTGGFTGGAQISRFFGFSQGFGVYNDEGEGMENILPRALHWIDTVGDEKFFLFLHSYDIHHPYDPPPPFNKMFFPDYDGPLGDSIPVQLIKDINKGDVKVSTTDIRYILSMYDGGIRYTDQYIGKLYEYLAEKGLLEKTIIVLTSDHGEEFDDHGIVGTHAHTVYDELLHVPLIFRLPGGAGTRVKERVGLVDLAPTLLDMVGVMYPEKIFQGVSFATMFRGQDPCGLPPRLQLAEREHLISDVWGRMKAVRSGDYKFKLLNEPPWKRKFIRATAGFVYPVFAKELYNMKEDPREQHNILMGHINRARAMEALLYRMTAWNAESRLKPDPDKLKLDKDEAQRLKNLGYIE